MSHLLKVIKEEMIKAIPAIIYFIISFNFIAFTESLMLVDHHYVHISYLSATLGGVILGKFLVIINSTRWVEAFADKPLIYAIYWKIFLYGSLSFVFRILDMFFETWVKLHHANQALEHVLVSIQSSVFWSIQIWIVVLFIIYVSVTEFVNALGKDKINRILYGERSWHSPMN